MLHKYDLFGRWVIVLTFEVQSCIYRLLSDTSKEKTLLQDFREFLKRILQYIFIENIKRNIYMNLIYYVYYIYHV